jgi:hypothetical protein
MSLRCSNRHLPVASYTPSHRQIGRRSARCCCLIVTEVVVTDVCIRSVTHSLKRPTRRVRTWRRRSLGPCFQQAPPRTSSSPINTSVSHARAKEAGLQPRLQSHTVFCARLCSKRHSTHCNWNPEIKLTAKSGNHQPHLTPVDLTALSQA